MKRLFLFLLAGLLVAGCSSTPKVVLGAESEEEEEVLSTPDWVVKLEEDRARRAEEKKQAEEEYAKLIAQQQKEVKTAAQKAQKEECKINGHDCWDVVKIFMPSSKASDEEQAAYLKKMGLSIKKSITYRDGGSKSIELSDGTFLWISNSLWDRSHNITVKMTNGKSLVYDTEGNQMKPIVNQ